MSTLPRIASERPGEVNKRIMVGQGVKHRK
jgi:hypothetical protein